MAHKIVIDLDVDIDADKIPELIEYLQDWYGPDSCHQTGPGTDYSIEHSMVMYEGEVEV
jgi:hypothetical protein